MSHLLKPGFLIDSGLGSTASYSGSTILEEGSDTREATVADTSQGHGLEETSLSVKLDNTLTIVCQEKNRAPCGMCRGSATTDCQFAYFTPYFSFSLYRYEYSTKKWEELSRCPYSFPGLTIINEELTTIGGWGYNKLMTLRQGKWVEEFPPMMTGRYCPAVATTHDDNYLIVIGGCVGEWRNGKWCATVELLQLKARKWYTAIALPEALHDPSATICGDQLNVIRRFGSGFSCSIQDLTPSNHHIALSWTPLPPLPVSNSVAVTLRGQLVLFGGKQRRISVNYVHQLVNGQWVRIGSMTRDRGNCLAVSPSSEKVLIVGGTGEAKDSVEECSVVV